MLRQVPGLLLLHLQPLGVHISPIGGGGLGDAHGHGALAVVRGAEAQADHQRAMMGAGGQADILVAALLHIAPVLHLGALAAHGAAGLPGRLALQGGSQAVVVFALFLAVPVLPRMNQRLGLLGILQHLLRVGQGGKDQGGIVGVMQGVVEVPLRVGLDVQHLHGRLEALALLGAVHVAEEPLDIAQGRQLHLAAEEVHVLLQHAHVIAAPGQQGIVLPAPGHELIHGLQELRRVGQLLRAQLGHPADAGVNLHVMHGPDGDGYAVDHLIMLVQLHRADLDHLEDQPVAHLPVHAAVIGQRLVPFQVNNDIVQRYRLLQ